MPCYDLLRNYEETLYKLKLVASVNSGGRGRHVRANGTWQFTPSSKLNDNDRKSTAKRPD
jgi:hypothetical protein